MKKNIIYTMIFKLLLLFSLILIFQSLFAKLKFTSNQIFDYKLLSKDSLHSDCITPDQFILINEKKIEIGNNQNIIAKEYIVDNKLGIKYLKYNLLWIDTLTSYRDRLEVLGTYFLLDSLFYGKNFSNISSPRNIILNSLYKFNYNEKNFICCFFQDITESNSYLENQLFLIDVTDTSNIIPILNVFQLADDLHCFGDFNNNNKLDFAYWSHDKYLSDTLFYYEFDSSKNLFDLVSDKFLIIEFKNHTYRINNKKSKWNIK